MPDAPPRDLPDSAGLSSSAAGPGPAVPLKSLRILVVEDDPVNQLFLERLLLKLGHLPRVVDDGLPALRELESQRYDCVLMDIQLPTLDGMETTRRIRATPPAACRPDIPIIAVTAYAMEHDRAQALAAGMDGHLAKPVDADSLREILDAIDC